MSALKMYVDFLLGVAKESGYHYGRPQPSPGPEIRDPSNFLQALFVILGKENYTTREGVEQVMDSLFSLPPMAPLLEDAAAVAFQEKFTENYLPFCTPLFQSYWNHIILPAWGQLRDIQRTITLSKEAAATICTTTSNTTSNSTSSCNSWSGNVSAE
jgi:hypothetical protein